MQLKDLVTYLDDYLAIGDVPDWKGAYNGLQMEGRSDVNRVAVTVDACQATIDEAVERTADLMLVHHGLFWGATAPVTGIYYRRLAALIKHDVALYSCHAPLDAHPEVGNNVVLARMLGLEVGGWFGELEGTPMGVWADAEMARDELVARVERRLGVTPSVIAAGPARTRRIGIISGGAGTLIDQAAAAGCDTYLTGEGPHFTYFDAEERGLNVLYAGHYATETVGVKALAAHLSERFSLETFFIDHPTGL